MWNCNRGDFEFDVSEGARDNSATGGGDGVLRRNDKSTKGPCRHCGVHNGGCIFGLWLWCVRCLGGQFLFYYLNLFWPINFMKTLFSLSFLVSGFRIPMYQSTMPQSQLVRLAIQILYIYYSRFLLYLENVIMWNQRVESFRPIGL